jgi:membrane protein DedA with SNARE-associated domain
VGGFAGLATALIDKLGLIGIGLGVFLNGLGVPGLSEVLLPLAGVAVRQGTLNFAEVFAVAMFGQMAGTCAAYAIARGGGLPLIERYGKYILISRRELDATEKAFARFGGRLVIVGAFIPGSQGFIGYAAGVAKMNFPWFFLSVFIGKVVWVGGLLYLGMLLGDHVGLIDQGIKQIGAAVLVLLLAAGLWYLYHRKRTGGRVEKQKGDTS